MENDYQISKDGTIFQIKEDGTISKLAKIENGKVLGVGEQSVSPPPDNNSGKGWLIFLLVAFAIATVVLGILYSQAGDNYYYALMRERELKQQVESLEEDVARLQNQVLEQQTRSRVSRIDMVSSGYVDAEPGETFRINYTITPSSAKNAKVSWYSTYPSIASVDQNGIITALKNGTTTIMARADGVEAKCNLEVRIKSSSTMTNIATSSTTETGYSSTSRYSSSSSSSKPMTLSHESVGLKVGQSITLSATGYGPFITWESDNTKVAIVNSNGRITAIGPGTTKIWAKGQEYKYCLVTVTSNVSSSNSNTTSRNRSQTSSSSLTNSSRSSVHSGDAIKVNESAQLSVPGKDVTSWSSNDPSVISVSRNGMITGKKVGRTTIWATCSDGKLEPFIITVRAE